MSGLYDDDGQCSVCELWFPKMGIWTHEQSHTPLVAVAQ